MVDTIKCQSELDLTEAFFEKLLLGAIDKRLDRQKVAAHSPANDSQDLVPTLPYRSKTVGNGKEPHWADDETLVASSSRGNSLHANRSSTMQTLHESPIHDARPKSAFEGRPSNMTTSRHASPPAAGFGLPSRHTTFHNTIQEAEESEPKAAQRSSTVSSHGSHWWNKHGP